MRPATGLKLCSRRLEACVRETDTVARLGGDEFALIQVGVEGAGEAQALCCRLLATLVEPFELDGHEIIVTASIGVALAPGDAEEPGRLLQYADVALYRAKAEGRNAFRFFEPEMDGRLQARRALERDLRTALVRGDLQVHYQLQVDARAEEPVGVEALARWHHAERGWVPPKEFIPVAEETGLILVLGGYCARPVPRPPPGPRCAYRSICRRCSSATAIFSASSAACCRIPALRPTGWSSRSPRAFSSPTGRRRSELSASSGNSACASPWTISARATRASATCRNSRSTRSRSTAPSSALSRPGARPTPSCGRWSARTFARHADVRRGGRDGRAACLPQGGRLRRSPRLLPRPAGRRHRPTAWTNPRHCGRSRRYPLLPTDTRSDPALTPGVAPVDLGRRRGRLDRGERLEDLVAVLGVGRHEPESPGSSTTF